MADMRLIVAGAAGRMGRTLVTGPHAGCVPAADGCPRRLRIHARALRPGLAGMGPAAGGPRRSGRAVSDRGAAAPRAAREARSGRGLGDLHASAE